VGMAGVSARRIFDVIFDVMVQLSRLPKASGIDRIVVICPIIFRDGSREDQS
jgi:hypothetical protein